jgi:hypothetical protein
MDVKLALFVWLMALLAIFLVAAFLMSHDPWIVFSPA